MLKRISVALSFVLLVAAAVVAAAPTRFTFHKDVAPILQKNCQGCHRPGEIAPMPLQTYAQSRPWAKSIREAVATRRMPPWFADPAHGKFSNDSSLSAAEIKTIVDWVDAGAPEGKPKDAPKPIELVDGWSIGRPDAIVETGIDFAVPASGSVNYQFIVAKTNFTEDRWVEKLEVRPSNRSVVHHAVVFTREPGAKFLERLKPGTPFPVPNSAPQRKLVDDGVGEIISEPEVLALYVPGTSAQVFQPGQAKLIKAGSDILFQMHYTTNGQAATDRTRIGFVFAKKPPAQRVMSAILANVKFSIPPGAAKHRVDARVTLDKPLTLSAFFPHMHMRGRGFEYRAVYPNGRTEVLLSVPRYDFNWQLFYYPVKPIQLPAGTRLECTAYFDNSTGNPGNPDPTAEVRWGDQTWEEMMAGFFDIAVDAAVDPKSLFGRSRRPTTAGN